MGARVKYKPVGGVGGHRATPAETTRARKAISGMKSAVELDGCLKGQTVVIMGNSSSMVGMDLRRLSHTATIGCNRALKWPDKGSALRKKWVPYPPTYLMVGDREPYCQERNAGRLKAYVDGGGKIIGSHSLFDPTVLLRGPYSNIMRRAQPLPDFPVYIYKIGTSSERLGTRFGFAGGRALYALEYDSFERSLDSCLNISGSMIQAAAIMGAKRIGAVGIELRWPKVGPSHAFGDGKASGAYSQGKATVEYTKACFEGAKKEFKKRGIEFLNLSPVKKCPFAEVFGNYSYEKFVKEL